MAVMDDGTKTLIGTIAALVALVACFGLMTNCSIKVARIDAQAEACAKAGGTFNRGLSEDDSYCIGKRPSL
jgi:hypothetical protein